MTTSAAASPDPTGPSSDEEPAYRYWAFISYSHHDIAWAKRLHARLEKWPIPRRLIGRVTPLGPIPRRLFPIFRDRDELSAGSSLDDVLRAALKQSRFLIVICSPHAAASKYVNEEIRCFKAAGRETRVIYVIVAGNPAAGDATDAGGCFPPIALQQVAPDGTCLARVEPIAADVRPGKDGPPNALLKILSRLLNVEFDELKRRELRRQRRARAISLLAGIAAALLAAAGYIALADVGGRLPGAEAIRLELDRHEASVFRRVPSQEQIKRDAAAVRAGLIAGLVERRQSDGWIDDAPAGSQSSISLISHSQAVAALLSYPDLDPAHRAGFIDSAEDLFRPGKTSERALVELNGVKWGWISEPGKKVDGKDNGQINAFVPLWTAIALCEAIERLDAHSDPALRGRLLRDLDATQQCLRLYRQDTEPGAWNAFPFQEKAAFHSVYAATLALLALNEACRAKAPWDGSIDSRDRLARQTVQWLVGQHQSDGGRCGWSNNRDEEHVNDIYDGLTAQAYAALLDAEQTIPEVMLPETLLEGIRIYLTECDARTLDYPVDVGEFRLTYRHMDGLFHFDKEAMRYLWWPWVVRGAELWLHYADRRDLPRAYRVQVRRTLAHLVVDLGPQLLSGVKKNYSYMLAEDLYGMRGL